MSSSGLKPSSYHTRLEYSQMLKRFMGFQKYGCSDRSNMVWFQRLYIDICSILLIKKINRYRQIVRSILPRKYKVPYTIRVGKGGSGEEGRKKEKNGGGNMRRDLLFIFYYIFDFSSSPYFKNSKSTPQISQCP